MTDLDDARAAGAARERHASPPWVRELGLRVDRTRCRARWCWRCRSRRAHVHGGGVLCGQTMMAAADTAMVLAVMTRLGGFKPMTTVQLQTSFLRPMAGDGGTRASLARVLRMGKNLVFGEIADDRRRRARWPRTPRRPTRCCESARAATRSLTGARLPHRLRAGADRPGAVAPAADGRLQPASCWRCSAPRASSWSAAAFEVLYPTHDEFERTGERIVASLDAQGWYADDRVMKRLAGARAGELFWCHVSGRALDPREPHAAGIWASRTCRRGASSSSTSRRANARSPRC